MKLRNILKRINKVLLVVLTLFGFTSQINAAASSLNFTHVNWQDKTSQSIPFSTGEDFHIKYVTGTNKYAYCNDYPYKTPSGVDYNLVEEITDPGKVYILKNGPTIEQDNNYLAYYKTQVAYWIYDLEKRGGGDANRDSSVRYLQSQVNNSLATSATAREIRNLVDEAKKQTSESDLTLSANTTNLTFKLSSDKKYYVSNDIKISSNGKYSVTVNGPTGTVKEDITGGFRIKVPASRITTSSTTVSATVNGSKDMYRAYLYKATTKASNGREYQSMSMIFKETTNKNISVSGKINITTKVEISKQDATTGKELPGAKLTVKDANGNVKDSWVSTNEPHVITGLSVGKYTLTEEIAPEGYVLSKETITFEIKADGSTTKVVMKNELEEKPKEPTSIYISKQDVTTGEELEGAKLELKNEKGELVEAWVSGKEPHEIKDLEPGKYYLTETLAPEGYITSTETVTFTVKEDGTVDGKIIMYNKPEEIVEVPSTSSFKTITTTLIGLIVIGLGSIIIYRNYKKNEEF